MTVSAVPLVEGAFIISGVDPPAGVWRGCGSHRSGVFVGGCTGAGLAGASASRDEVRVGAPGLGQFRLHQVEADVGLGQWLVTDDLFVALRAAAAWRPDEGHDAAVRTLAPGEHFSARYAHGWSTRVLGAPGSEVASSLTLDEGMAAVEGALLTEVKALARGRRPLMLLLSGGVDSGLLAALLVSTGAAVVGLTLSTPWGDELRGASRTATYVGLPLVQMHVAADEVLQAVPETLRWLQPRVVDTETVAIQVLVTVAARYAAAYGYDLVTGMGSDLLNATTETGHAELAGVPASERVAAASATGLMQTNDLGSSGPHRVHHPYWTAATIAAQLAVTDRWKLHAGHEKYYLRSLAAHRLPVETAFGTKYAIHERTGLVQGLQQTVHPTPLEQYVRDAWGSIVDDELGAPTVRTAGKGTCHAGAH